MMNRLRIAVAEDDVDHLTLLRRTIQKMGHEVAGTAATGRELVELCRAEHPGLVITDIRMPDMDGLDAAKEIYESEPVPIIVATSHCEPEFVERALERHILAFLVKPLDEANLTPAIAIVLRRFEEFQALKQENASLVQALEERKVIERAKGLLMKQLNIDEAAAFKRLQKIARDQRKRLAEVAQILVTAAEMMRSN
ncbi:MAG: response regulator [Planctomycetia bacterium]|nr:response regulator [Planctomycetia bacterium]